MTDADEECVRFMERATELLDRELARAGFSMADRARLLNPPPDLCREIRAQYFAAVAALEHDGRGIEP